MDPDEVQQELARMVACLACTALNTADNLNQDCDQLDNALLDGSCP